MKKMKKYLVYLLIFAMSFSLTSQSTLAAKKKVKLDKKKVTVNVGKTVKIKLKNNTKKVKWSVTSGKKNIVLSKKKKTGVTIKGKKVGKAKVQAKVGKKKYICQVTVSKKKTNKGTDKSTNKNTDVSHTTASPTSSPEPTKEPVQTMLPPDETPTPGGKYKNLYAEEQKFIVSSVDFDKKIESVK